MLISGIPILSVGMESIIDERGRVLIPQEIRTEFGLTKGTVVQLQKGSREGIVLKPARRRVRTWRDLFGMKPVRTGKPEWPSVEEIKSIWE